MAKRKRPWWQPSTGDGTLRKNDSGTMNRVSPEGVCECGWKKKNVVDASVLEFKEYCSGCEKYVSSVCCGEGCHECPECLGWV
jgi:hypothetical protein